MDIFFIAYVFLGISYYLLCCLVFFIFKQIRKLQDLHNSKQRQKRSTAIVKSISLRKENTRQHNPSLSKLDNSGKLDLEQQRASERMSETIECLSTIHGATKQNLKPALDGAWSALVNKTSDKELASYIENTPKVMTKSVPTIMKKKVKEFEESDANAARSLKLVYSGGLISKSKYKEQRNDSVLPPM